LPLATVKAMAEKGRPFRVITAPAVLFTSAGCSWAPRGAGQFGHRLATADDGSGPRLAAEVGAQHAVWVEHARRSHRREPLRRWRRPPRVSDYTTGSVVSDWQSAGTRSAR
jgi:hypothetical protein